MTSTSIWKKQKIGYPILIKAAAGGRGKKCELFPIRQPWKLVLLQAFLDGVTDKKNGNFSHNFNQVGAIVFFKGQKESIFCKGKVTPSAATVSKKGTSFIKSKDKIFFPFNRI